MKVFEENSLISEGVNYMGFGKMPKSIVFSDSLNTTEKMVYAYLTTYANQQNIAFPSEKRIANDLKIGENKLRKALKILRKCGYIEVSKSGRHNVYALQVDTSTGYGVLPKAVLLDKRISLKAKAIYVIHCCFAGIEKCTFLGVNAIISALQICEKSYYAYQKELVECGYLTSTQRYYKEQGRFGVNDYVLNQKPQICTATKAKSIGIGTLNECGRFVSESIKTFVKGVKNKIIKPKFPKLKNQVAANNADFFSGNIPMNSPKITQQIAQSEAINYRKVIAENIGLKYILQDDDDGYKSQVSELYEIICEMCQLPEVKISGQFLNADFVRERLLTLDNTHIDYVISCVKEVKKEIKNVKEYLKTCLWNAPLTMDNYYTLRVNYDLYDERNKGQVMYSYAYKN